MYDEWRHDPSGAMANHQHPPSNTVQKEKTADTKSRNPFFSAAVAAYTLLYVHRPRTRSRFFKFQATWCGDECD